MQYITRRKYVNKKVEDFLDSSKSCLTLDLYSSEIRKLSKVYPSLEIKKGQKTLASSDDKRYSCVISKK